MRKINLIYGHNGRNFIFIDEIDNLFCLIFDTFSCRNYKNDEVSNSSPSSTHITKSFMTGSIDKSDFLSMTLYMKSSYFLGNTSNLSLSDIRFSKVVNECGFTVINMSHDCNNWRFFFIIHLVIYLFREFDTIDDGK
jgi:hypothetical protein